MKGLFGDMFDFNRDGKLDSLEQAAEAMHFHEAFVVKKDKKRYGSDTDDGHSFDGDPFDVDLD